MRHSLLPLLLPGAAALPPVLAATTAAVAHDAAATAAAGSAALSTLTCSHGAWRRAAAECAAVTRVAMHRDMS